MHTTCSDGVFSPYELVKRCKQRGLSVIAITDHDSVAAFPDAIAYGKEFGVEVIPGVELSAMVDEKDVHILGYFIDYTSARLQEYLEFFRRERIKRAERIVAKLNSINVPLSIDSVMQRAGTGSVGRPHIASAMVEKGYIQSYQEAFERFIGNGGPAFEKKFNLSPEDAIKLISSSGGLSFLAHPGRYTPDEAVIRLIKSGLDGIETIHPSHTPAHTAHYRGVVGEYYLLESGGSDFHGGKKNDDDVLGSYYIDEGKVGMMKRRLFSQQSPQ
ncbi:MAG: PHP domain-containing protein [Bacteroidetes bacterium]|nr:MAG: PHP domain-containing protein [Bacteroidota bacterium]